MQAKVGCLSGAQLKAIAMASMLADHLNKAVIYRYLDGGGVLEVISDIFDVIGRLAFPVFCFLLVEGFMKTKSRLRYLWHLIVFGILSEVLFDMMTSGVIIEWNWNNVMFTFALLLLTLWAIDALRGRTGRVLWYCLSVLILAAGCAAAVFLSVDYDYHAILMGCFFYLFYDRPPLALPFCALALYKTPAAWLGILLCLAYNGRRGRQQKLVAYSFYPAHMLILGILRMILKI